MVGAAAMRQAAEDVSAHSAVKEGSIGPISYVRNKWQKFRLRSAAEEVAKKNFPEKEQQKLTKAVMKAFKTGELDKGLKEMSWEEKRGYLLTTMQTKYLRSAAEEVAKKNFPEKEQQKLTEAVMKAFKTGELDKGLKEMSWEEKQRYLLATMQTMREEYLRSAAEEVAEYFRRGAEEVAKGFPKEERQNLTEAVVKAFKNGELDQGFMSDGHYLLRTMNRLRELPVAASAVKFCSNLFREANSEDPASIEEAESAAEYEADKAARICHKVLAGESVESLTGQRLQR